MSDNNFIVFVCSPFLIIANFGLWSLSDAGIKEVRVQGVQYHKLDI